MFQRLSRLVESGRLRIVVLLAVVSILLLMPLPRSSRELDILGDLGHAPLFGLLAAMLYFWGRAWLPRQNILAALSVWGLVVLVGIGFEFLQNQLGRHGSWSDVYANMWGTTAFLVWSLSSRWDSRFWRATAACIGIACLAFSWRMPMRGLADTLLQRSEMPILGSFERKSEFARWYFQDCRVAQSSKWASHGEYSLLAELQPARYPSLSLYWPVQDWSAYGSLTLDIVLVGDDPLPIVVKIEDDYKGRKVHDRYNGRFTLRPGENRVEVNLLEVAIAPKGRTLNLQRIRRLQVFTSNLKEPRRLLIDNVRLRP